MLSFASNFLRLPYWPLAHCRAKNAFVLFCMAHVQISSFSQPEITELGGYSISFGAGKVRIGVALQKLWHFWQCPEIKSGVRCNPSLLAFLADERYDRCLDLSG